MIPRKKLQVLLYVLQIFYVFGDGDPGGETHHLPVDDSLLKNLVDDPDYATDLPYVNPHRIYERVTSVEDDLSLTNELPTIESVNIIDTQKTSFNVTWTVSNGTSTKYNVTLYEQGELKKNYTTENLYQDINNLEPCTKYRVGVSVYSPDHQPGNATFNETTTLIKTPGEPRDLRVVAIKNALQVTWQRPKVGGRCVKHYIVRIDNNWDQREFTEINDTVYTVENVHACRIYAVTVLTVDKDDQPGKFAKNESISTLPDVTIPPRLNESESPVEITKNSIGLSWILSDDKNNCLLESMEVECTYNFTEGNGYQLLSNNVTVNFTGEDNPMNVSVVVDKLSAFTHYNCRARTVVRDLANNASDWSKSYRYVTSEDVPSPPREFKIINMGELSRQTFMWKEPAVRPGKMLPYKIEFQWKPNYKVPDFCNANNSRVRIHDKIDAKMTEWPIEIEDEFSESFFIAAIYAQTSAGWSERATVEGAIMQIGVPDKVTNLTYEIVSPPQNPNTLETFIYWQLPCVSKGWLNFFEISFEGTREGYPSHNMTKVESLPDEYDNNKVFQCNFGELKPLYTYTFTVTATIHSSISPGEPNNLTMIYPAGIPPQPNDEYIRSITLDPQKSHRSTSTAFVLLPLFPPEFGEIKYYAIMVSSKSFGNESARYEVNEFTKTWPDVKTWEEAKEESFRVPYQATVAFWKPPPDNIADYGNMKAIKFIIGEDLTCPQISTNSKGRVYCNGPLNSDSWYEVRMRAFTEKGYADSASFIVKTNAELNVGLVLGVVFGILFIGITTTLMLMIKRCSVRLLVQRILQSSINESPVPNPFTRRKFINHCQQLAENPAKLTNEFQLLQTLSVDLQMPSNHACLQGNRKKNRYSDILPYDFSRVKLEVIDNDPCSDYINASFVKGYSGDDEYIACQGPKEETTYDFWRMIDQYDVKIILMLTQLVERGKEKCHQYFPTARETFTYEKFSIKCTSELNYRNYTQRILILEKDGLKRAITHWHFKDWPDHDVPDDFDAMLHFVQMFRKQLNSVKGLSVIHCSAGIGRTGTLIAIDILLQSLKDCRKIDVFGTVYRLRRHRLNMVQRESQYAYIYNCIRQVLKNPYFSKTYKPPPIDPIYAKAKTQKDRSDSSTDLVESFDTLTKNSLSTSIDSMQPLCQSSPQATPKIQMNGLRYCKSTSAIDTRSNHNRLGKYNSEHYVACETRDSFSTTSKDSAEDDERSSTSSIYENVEPLIRTSSSQTIAGTSYIPLMNDAVEKDTSL